MSKLDEGLDWITPTQYLIMDLLTARYRLGDEFWTFESKNKRALLDLEARGWVYLMHGIAEHTIRAGMTNLGKAQWGVSPPKCPTCGALRHE